MGKKKKTDLEEALISRAELMELRGLSENFIRANLKSIEFNLGYRTRKYKLSEVDAYLAQKRVAG